MFENSRVPVVVSCLVVQAVTIGAMLAYGVFFKSLETELGWNRTLLSAVTSMSFLVMGVLAIAAGRLNDRFGPRWVMTTSGIAFGIGYGLMYFLHSPWQLFLLYGLFFGIALSTHDVVTLSVIARWFKSRRGQMTGFVKCGTAVGQIILPLVAATLITQLGWRTAFLIIGVSGAILLVTVAQFMRRDPPPAVIAQQRQVGSGDAWEGISYAAAKKTRQFWTLCAIQLAFFQTLVTVPLHIAPHAQDLGFTQTVAASVLSTIAACSIIGRLTIGTLIDRIGVKRGYLIGLVPLLTGLLMLLFIKDPTMLFVFAVVYGIGHGGCFTVVSPAVADLFGMQDHGGIFGVVLFFGTIGAAIGPWVAGWIFDSYGSYDAAWIALAALVTLSIVMVLTLKPLQKSA